MKLMVSALALALVFAPAAGLAQQTTNPDPGGTSQSPLPIFSSVPVGTVVVSGLVVSVVTGIVVGVFVGDEDTVTTTTTTN